MIELLYGGLDPLQSPGSPYSWEDHRTREPGSHQGDKRTPRRSQTQYNYQLPQPPVFSIRTIRHQARAPEDRATSSNGESEERPKEERAPRRRPALGPPRRSYSVTDHEPLPHHHRPSAEMTLLDLPPELHFAIFDFLDPIDSTCLGLTNRHFYAIHRRMHGSVPLSVRRDGPNELEWAWHLAARTIQAPLNPKSEDNGKVTAVGNLADQEKHALSMMRIRGQAYCRKCGVTRCELHKHIQSWMGEAEYCCITEKFGTVALPGAKSYCYMSKPGDKKRCGRHYVRKSKVVLQ
ncbi:hypothetical protein B0T22DRAFT_484223 [Podospora appendiculata]|uniref:F-box domain-containing protein n=1 Tax=Podospora appendiculata TaxID=314037 RepID=A0AAE0X0F2_9PEZI|nr:hypothetical protein B0T22DRAFT_484223 [Podospora appendiculata]